MSNQRTKTISVCTFCGKQFHPFRASKALYCSNSCKFDFLREKRKRSCAHCGIRFSPPEGKRPKHCSPACYHAAKKARSFTQRLEPFIDKTNDCWIWRGNVNSMGYGRVWFEGKSHLVHRLMFERFTGEAIGDKVVRHFVCDNPPCCNPAHLRSGSKAENSRDAVRKSRHAHGETTYAKLSEADVRAIIEDPRSSVELAAVFGVTPRTIRHARNGTTWKHLHR